MDELAAVQQAIEMLHRLMVVLQDPADVRVVAQCLSALTGIQRNMMAQQQGGQAGNAQQALIQQLRGGGGQPQPQGQPVQGGGY